MTDQDPTQRYAPPAPDSLPAADAAVAGTPPAVEAPTVPPPAPMPMFEPVPTTPVASVPASAPASRPGRNRLKWLVAAVVTRAGGGHRRRRHAHAHRVQRRPGRARVDPRGLHRLRGSPPGPPGRSARRAGQGHDGVPRFRRPGGVPRQAQRGPRHARRPGIQRQDELPGRHRAVVRWPGERQHGADPGLRRRVRGPRSRARQRHRRRQGRGVGLQGPRGSGCHHRHRVLQRRDHQHGHPAPGRRGGRRHGGRLGDLRAR